MVPGDAVSAYLSPRSLANPDIVAAFKEKWGLNDSLWVQYLNYMTNLVKLDLGVSIRTGNPVVEELGRSYPATMELAFFSILFASIMGILFGIVSATKRNSFIDQWLRAISVTGVSIPSFWFAIIVLFIFYSKLGWAPGIGRLSLRVSPPEHISGMYVLDGLLTGNIIAVKDALAHLILPAIVLGSFTMGLITRTTRSSLLETLSSDYIRTARAKGLTDRGIMVVHAFGNAAIPVLTVIGV
ncbi:MAG: ABC transporter permease, partial [Spirochaetaceae bacterium]|nr:ABC transporter permease [Spirochaetaceae bacterium]